MLDEPTDEGRVYRPPVSPMWPGFLKLKLADVAATFIRRRRQSERQLARLKREDSGTLSYFWLRFEGCKYIGEQRDSCRYSCEFVQKN